MKATSILLALYVFALALIPCSDEVVSTTVENDQSIFAAQEQSQGHSESHTDLCSPFCSCQCCQISVIHFEKPALPTLPRLFPGFQDGYSSCFESRPAFDIFQPPRA